MSVSQQFGGYKKHPEVSTVSAGLGNDVPKVLYFDSSFSGGAAVSLLEMVKAHHSMGGHALVEYNRPGFAYTGFEKLSDSIELDKFYYRSWLNYGPQKRSLDSYCRFMGAVPYHFAHFLRLIARARTRKVQLVHTNRYNMVEGAWVSASLGLPHIWHIRELLDLDYYAPPRSKEEIARTMNALSTFVLCPSKRAAEGLLKLGFNPDKLRVLYNVVDVVPENNRIDLRDHLGLDKNVKLVAIVGALSSNKRVEDFLEMASRMIDCGDQVKFLVIGAPSNSQAYQKTLEDLFEASANRKNIIFTGIIAEVDRYMGSLDVLLCPCFTESFGRTTAEALAQGVPAIGVGSCAVAEIIDHDETGYLVSSGDVGAMENHTRKLLTNETQRRAFGELGIERVRERFSSPVIGEQLKGIYSDAKSRGGMSMGHIAKWIREI
jgi:glycosyltransferase involved in cell wall biosynthesis